MTIIEGNLTPPGARDKAESSGQPVVDCFGETHEPKTGMSIEDVKRELPGVKIATGLGMIANGQLSGRENDFATVHYCASLGLGIRAKAEFPWETVTRAINNDTPLGLG